MSYVKGEAVFQIFYNQKNNYGVYRIAIDETDEPSFDFQKIATITGYFQSIEIGAVYLFKGSMIFTEKYGYSFVTNSYERVLPTSREGIIEYLSGESFKGIGKKTADLVVETLGLDCISKIEENKAVLDLVSSLSEQKKEVIYQGLINNRDLESTLISLYSYDITPKMAMRIYEKYGASTMEVIKRNPYALIDSIEGIAFVKADQIALRTGIDPKSENRVQACLLYTLMNNANETGNTYMSKEELLKTVQEFLGFVEDDEELLSLSLSDLVYQGKVVDKGLTVQDSRLFNSEKYIALKLKKLTERKIEPFFKEEVFHLIKDLEEKLDISYEEEQKSAIARALDNNVSIITGGPGTGKTTIERGILYVYTQLINSDHDVIKLCAPTGKAAKRIEESTSYEARTIHKLLGYDASGNFAYDKFNPLPIKLLILDEASMVDVFLFRNLLEALNDDCRIVIVGDSDQLPSIGPGQVLKDLIDSNVFVTTKLTKIHRQKENSKIISLAYDVLDGEITTELDESHDELVFVPSKPEDFLETLKATIDHYTAHGYSLYQSIQILIPIYKSMVGIEAVNRYLQMKYNPNYNPDYPNDLSTFYMDDKVIQLVNQYEDGVMNGDMGIVSDTPNEKELTVDFQGTIVKYKGDDVESLQLAYAISVHKAQGSEFPVVILPFFSNYRILLNKKLVYTAVTRAKEHLVIIGDGRAFRNAIKINSCDRETTLKSFL